MAISLQADSTLPQGYILVDGQRVASVSTTGGLSATLAANTVTTNALVSGSVTTEKIAPGAVVTADLADGAVTAAKLSQPLTLDTAKTYNWNAQTNNTTLNFDNIPSWAKRVTIAFSQLSVNDGSRVIIQVGTSSVWVDSNYRGTIQWGDALRNNFSLWFPTSDDGSSTAAYSRNGIITLVYIGSNIWAATILMGTNNQNDAWYGAGSVTLPDTLTRIRFTTPSGTAAFDAGIANVMYEG